MRCPNVLYSIRGAHKILTLLYHKFDLTEMNRLTIWQTLMKHLISSPSTCLFRIWKGFLGTVLVAEVFTKQNNKTFA